VAVAAAEAAAEAVAVAVAVAAAVVVVWPDEQSSNGINTYEIEIKRYELVKISLLACGIVTSVAVGFSLQAASETKKKRRHLAIETKKQFTPRRKAADSLVQAAESFDVAVLTRFWTRQ